VGVNEGFVLTLAKCGLPWVHRRSASPSATRPARGGTGATLVRCTSRHDLFRLENALGLRNCKAIVRRRKAERQLRYRQQQALVLDPPTCFLRSSRHLDREALSRGSL
jgi:hypothetical protein